MPAPHCFGSVQFHALLVARLDALGSPDPGTENLYVSDAGVEMSVQPQTQEGAVLEQANGQGANCVRFQDCDRTVGVNLGLTLCVWDITLAEILTAGVLEVDGSTPVGFAAPDPETTCPNGVVIEGYALAMDGSSRAPHPVSGLAAYWRYRFPKVTWAPGDWTLGNTVQTQPFKGKGVPNQNIGLGPLGNWPSVPAGAYAYDLVDSIPDVACGYQELEAVPS